MSFALVLVAGHPDHPLGPYHFAKAEHILADSRLRFTDSPRWLNPHKAADIVLDDAPPRPCLDHLRLALNPEKIDVFVTSLTNRRKTLLLADMDATIVTSETLDELADFVGLRERIAAITARAMKGELDFQSALAERVALLKDLPVRALDETLSTISLSKGAIPLVRTMAKDGATCVLVSGGFTFFTKEISEKVGFHHHHGNTLEINEDRLTGWVVPPILDKKAKLEFLQRYTHSLGLTASQTMTIGDGANDLPMLENAGLGIGYQPKPLVAERIPNLIVHTDLTSALYVQGYTADEIQDSPA